MTDTPDNFKTLLKYAIDPNVKSAVIVVIGEDNSIMIGASQGMDQDSTSALLTESAALVAGKFYYTTLH